MKIMLLLVLFVSNVVLSSLSLSFILSFFFVAFVIIILFLNVAVGLERNILYHSFFSLYYSGGDCISSVSSNFGTAPFVYAPANAEFQKQPSYMTLFQPQPQGVPQQQQPQTSMPANVAINVGNE